VTIREATLLDTEVLIAMTHRFLASSSYGFWLGKAEDERLVRLVLTVFELGTILVADDGGDVVGMIALAAVEHPVTGRRFAEELAWWVEPEQRRGTTGPRLLRAAEEWCRKMELSVVKMVAPAGSDVGRFYRRMGYTEVETAWQKGLC